MNSRVRTATLGLFCAALLEVSALRAPAATAPRATDNEALALTKRVASDLRAGRLDRSLLAPKLDALLDGPALAGAERTFARLGEPRSVSQLDREDRDGVTTRTYLLVTDGATEFLTVGLDDATGKIATLFTRPGPPK